MNPRYCQPSGSGTSSWPRWAVIAISSTPGTSSAASWPRTATRRPARGIGIIITPAARRSRSNESIFQPSAWRRISSSSVMPVPNRRVREQRPPIERAATSMTQGPASFTRSSAWMGPWVSPSAALARRAYGILRQRHAAEPGRRDAGGVEPLTHLVLVAGGGGGGDRVGPEAQARTDRGGDDGGEIVHGDDRVDRPAAGEARDGLRGADGLGEVEGE